jgi:hypothetical protein
MCQDNSQAITRYCDLDKRDNDFISINRYFVLRGRQKAMCERIAFDESIWREPLVDNFTLIPPFSPKVALNRFVVSVLSGLSSG